MRMYWKCEKLRLLVIPQENESYEHFGVAHLPKHPPRADKSATPLPGADKGRRDKSAPTAISYTQTSAGT